MNMYCNSTFTIKPFQRGVNMYSDPLDLVSTGLKRISLPMSNVVFKSYYFGTLIDLVLIKN